MHAVDYLNVRGRPRVKSDGSKLESGHPSGTFYKLGSLKTLFEQFRYISKYLSSLISISVVILSSLIFISDHYSAQHLEYIISKTSL